MPTKDIIILIGKRLQESLPGLEAQIRMAPSKRFAIPDPPDPLLSAAVLILLFPDDESWRFFLTERTHGVEHHQGQISLPGGAREKDESLEAAAIRETQEEMGISETPEIIGQLSQLHIPVSGFEVSPFVGWLSARPEVEPNNVEVARVHEVTLADFLATDCHKWEKRTFRSIEIEVPYFELDGVKVWGATAMILSEFRQVLQEALTELRAGRG
ncbi:MAG: CoA pyrophosphatase [Candidatus Marinimicrobia bacterium]|jgi:8-oxo-dGTP pyrophosphatase MutT (NUDIX family)|nr:CoA pyrophosphatase [Candidatus Neomarinimicrobiota bacterium]